MDFEELLKGRVCECGMTHTCAIKHIIIGKDANKKLAPLLEGYKKVLLVADTNTYAACGETIRAQIGDKLEGAKHQETVARYERDQGNRKACIAHYGYVCQVCGMDFAKTYGELGKEYIEVHHLHPVSQGERKVDPIEDLIPLCANCHSMIHRLEDVSDWKGLKQKYEECKAQNN